jgi:hypothetical protein
MAAPDRVPWGLRQGLIPWMERRYQPAVPAAQAAGPQAQAGQQAWQPPANWPTPAFYGAMRQAPSWAQQTYLPQMGYGR